MGELFNRYRPKSLEELASIDRFQISREDFQELADVVCTESHETLEALQREVENIDRNIFPLDAYYTLQRILDEFDFFLRLTLSHQDLQEKLSSVRQELDRKNPIGEVAAENNGYVLLHTSDTTSLKNILRTENAVAEICATASSLRTDGDIFRSATKEAEAGSVYNPTFAAAWFSKDVGSVRKQGKRVLTDPRAEQFRVTSLKEALVNKSGPRVEAWVDAVSVKPEAVLLLDQTKSQEIVTMAAQFDLPVLYNARLFEKDGFLDGLADEDPSLILDQLRKIKELKEESLETNDERVYEELANLSEVARNAIERIRRLNVSAAQAVMVAAYRHAAFDPIDMHEMGFNKDQIKDLSERL